MEMVGRTYTAVSSYRYGFNGKEKDKDMHSLTAYDYGFRIYNPAIGKFLSLDPLQKDYPELTPYQFASNSPIANIDLDGLEKHWYKLSMDSKTGITTLELTGTMHRQPTMGDAIMSLFGRSQENFHGAKYAKEIIIHAYRDDVRINILHFNYFKEVLDWHFKGYPGVSDNEDFLNANAAASEYNKQVTLQLQMMTLQSMVDNADGDIDGYTQPGSYAKVNTSTTTSTNKQATAANGGNSQAASSNTSANATSSSTPTTAYNRKLHYGNTPTAADRKALGAGGTDDVDHTIPLVKHYYEGDGTIGCKPGYMMSQGQRLSFAQNRLNMTVKPNTANRSEGGKLTQYSKDMKKKYNLGASIAAAGKAALTKK